MYKRGLNGAIHYTYIHPSHISKLIQRLRRRLIIHSNYELFDVEMLYNPFNSLIISSSLKSRHLNTLHRQIE